MYISQAFLHHSHIDVCCSSVWMRWSTCEMQEIQSTFYIPESGKIVNFTRGKSKSEALNKHALHYADMSLMTTFSLPVMFFFV